jgi:acetyl-CoA carboxylase biotin carboxyl carrier protein
MAQLDIDLIRHALTVAQKNGFAEVELEIGDDSFSAKLAALPRKAPAPEPAVPSEPAETGEKLGAIKSTLVGFYREAKVPMQVGARVEKGDVVAIIGALGIANDIESPISGEVVEVLVVPNQPVEFGQVLARIRE